MTKLDEIAGLETKRKVPNGWRWVQLGQVCKIAGENINPQQESEEVFAHYSVSAYDRERVPAMEPGAAILSNKILFPRGAVLFCKLNPRISRVWYVSDDHRHRRICSTEFLPLVPHSSSVDPNYLRLILQEPELVAGLRARVAAATKSRERLRPGVLLAAEISLPGLSEQRRIAVILNERMAAVEQARAAAKAQLEAAKALPAAYLRAVFNSPDAQQWPRTRLEDLLVAPLKTGISKHTVPNATKRCLTLSAVRGGELDLTISKPVDVSDSEAKGNWVRPGAFYVVRGNGNLSLVGRGALAPSTITIQVLYPDLLIEVKVDPERIHSSYLRWVWNSDRTRDDIESRARTSAGIYKINQANLAEVTIPLPTVHEQQRMVAMLNEQMAAVERTRKALEDQLDMINSLPATLLRRAFTGEL